MVEREQTLLERLVASSKQDFLDNPSINANHAVEKVFDRIVEAARPQVVITLMEQTSISPEELAKREYVASYRVDSWSTYLNNVARDILEAEMCQDPLVREEAKRRYGHG